MRQQEEYLAEIRSLELTLPDLTFDKTLILHRPDRDVVLLFLGRGHTSGDVVAYLPKQRVVATGDLLHGWMPFMGDSYPPEWVATLDALDKLDFDHIIGGHGGVKPKSHLRFFRNYLSDLIAEVRRARDRSESLAQATTAVTAALAPKYDAGMEGRFAGSVGANIAKVYQDLVDKRVPRAAPQRQAARGRRATQTSDAMDLFHADPVFDLLDPRAHVGLDTIAPQGCSACLATIDLCPGKGPHRCVELQPGLSQCHRGSEVTGHTCCEQRFWVIAIDCWVIAMQLAASRSDAAAKACHSLICPSSESIASACPLPVQLAGA